MKVAVCLIATRKYHQFVAPLIEQIRENFLPEHQRVVLLFTDQPTQSFISTDTLSVVQVIIPSYKYPEVTLFRYRFFSDNKSMLKLTDYIFYMDVDVAVPERIGEEVLNPLTVVHHCGFFRNGGWGSPNVNPKSTAYFDEQFRKEYVMGGFNGGETKEFLAMSELLARNIGEDEKKGVRAEWFDESHLNFYISTIADRDKVKVLPPSYCMVESAALRNAWGIDDLPAYIVALDKNHSEIRN